MKILYAVMVFCKDRYFAHYTHIYIVIITLYFKKYMGLLEVPC